MNYLLASNAGSDYAIVNIPLVPALAKNFCHRSSYQLSVAELSQLMAKTWNALPKDVTSFQSGYTSSKHGFSRSLFRTS